MTGRIIFEPRMPTACERGHCEDKPRAADYRDGTIWECDHCGRQWVVWSGAQYNEPFSAWKVHRETTDQRCICYGAGVQPNCLSPDHTDRSGS